jgi:hypothetical protein
MSVEFASTKKHAKAGAALPTSFISWFLNWLALFVGVGLCAWAVSYGTALLNERLRPTFCSTSLGP